MINNETKEAREKVSIILRKWRARTCSENWTNFPDAYFAQQLGVTRSQFSQYLNCIVTMPLPIYFRLMKIVPKEYLDS